MPPQTMGMYFPLFEDDAESLETAEARETRFFNL